MAEEGMGENQVELIRARVPSYSSPPSLSSAISQRNTRKRPCTAPFCFLAQNRDNFRRTAAPLRLMYYRNGAWVDFSRETVESLRSGFVDSRPVVDVVIDGAKYVFDFLRMLQIDFRTGHSRSISWIDENGKCFFPKRFCSEDDCPESENNGDDKGICHVNNSPKIEIEIKIDGAPAKRKREEPEVTSSLKAERAMKNQRLMEACRWPNARLLREAEGAYLFARHYFLAGIKKVDPNAAITAIYQFMRGGPMERARFQVFRAQGELTKANRGAVNMVYAWHGTSAKGVESILANGFRLPSKVPVSQNYGTGVYLSQMGLPHLSAKLAEADDNGEKHLILCRVILGNIEKLEAGSGQYHPSSLNFDTGSDDPENPKWYVVWSTNINLHILPEFIVSYKPGRQCTIDMLLSKLETSLPPAKANKVLTLYRTFRDGILARDAFLSQLRLTAGDDMLQTAFQAICASG